MSKHLLAKETITMLKATSLASRAVITTLKFVRHISAAPLGAVRGVCPRSAAIHRGLHRSLSLALILAVFSTSTLADARSLAGIASEAQVSLAFWLNSAGLAGLLRRVFAGQQGPPEVKQQESQAERNERVASIGIMPGDLKVRLGERVMFEAVAYDKAGVPVGGIDFQWEAQDVGRKLRARISPRGEFEARIPGTVIVTAVGAGQKAQTTVYVLDGVVPKRDAARETMRQVSSRDLPSKSDSDPKLRSSSVVPMLMNDGFDNSNYWSADDPGNRRGNPPGSPPDEGAGSGNFQLSAPVLELPSRGMSLSLDLVYNSRLWNKAGSQITYDIDKDWPAPGWSLGFGKMMGMGVDNGSMLIDPDGTRHSYAGVVTYGYNYSYTYFNGHTSDGTLTDYTHYTGTGGALTWGEARRSDGTTVQYGASSQDALYPTRITDANGNYITITYVNNVGPRIQTITDTMGRTVSFYYDSYNLLTGIVGPGLAQGTRTLVRIHYRQIALNYGFSGVTTRVRDPYPWVIDAIYYPGTGTGYWFGDNDSYSSYGMIAKAVEQRGMIFSAPSLNVPGMVAPGSMTEQMVYNYPLAPNYSLTDAPTFTTQTETWAFMDTPAAVTTYFLQQNAFPRRTEITLPNGTRSVQLSFNAPGQFNDGMVYEDNTYDANSNLLHKSTTSWAQGAYNAPRPVRIELRDERGQVTATEFDYGPQYNQVTTLRSYDFGGVTLLRTAFMQYENGATYTYRHIFNLVKVAEVYAADGTRASRTEYQFDGQTLTDTPGVVMHSDAYNPYAPVYLVPGYCYWVCDDYCHEVCEPDYWVSDYDPSTNARGNVTQVTSYADALYLTGPATETKRYDIDGNMVASSTSCCDQTSHNYTLATQYAYPASTTQGAVSNPAAQVTQSDTYDFNTGLCVTSTDANGRTSQTTYFAQTIRPQVEYTPTGAYTTNAYDESAMSISETTYTAGGAVAAQNVSFLDGLGHVRREEALTEGGAWDVVEARLDALGRLWRQTRPYRNGQEQPQWNVFTFDALSRVTRVQAPDGSETNMFYNEASRPDAATPGLPGETMRMVDSWGRERWRLTDAHKRLAEVVEPNPAGNGSVATGGLLTRYGYDGLDKLTAITQGNQQRSFRFDALGRLTHQKLSEASPTLNDSGQFVGAGSWSEVSTYDERSNLTSRTDARGVKTVFAYNADPLNRIQSISYDTSGFGDTGNPIVAAPTITYEYSTTGDVRRISRLTTSGVSTEDFTFDVEGRVNSKTVTLVLRPSYPLITDYIYDSLDRLTDVRYPAEYGYGGAPRKVVHHNFDVASRLSSVQVDGVNYASQVGYNAGSQVTSLNVGINQVTESYTYDAATGFITGQKVQRGGTTLLDLGYDYLRPNTSTGRSSQLTRISNNLDHNKDRGYSYDALGRLAQATGGASMWTENYAYDRYGNRTSVTSSGYAAVTNPPYCTPTQILGVDPFVRNFYQGALNRQPNTPELQYWGNLLRQAYAQGQQRLLAACQSFGWALFQSQEYANRFRSDRDYVYDLYWAYLQRAPDQGGWDFWTGQVAANGRDQVRRAFDVSGEFSNKVGTLCPWATGVPIPRDGLAAVSYDVTSNRINSPGFAYDAAGNQTRVLRSDGSWQRFQYDAGGRLANVKNDNGLVLAVYTYGTRNRRLITQDGESTWNLRTYYAWDGEDVIAEYTESNASPFAPQWSKSYVFLYDRLLATLQPGAGSEYVQYDHPDRLGTRLISNASDTSVQEQVTLPFGTALDAESTGVLKKRFTSYDRGSTTGLDYAINRHYDPQQGRFTQVDPIGMDAASLADPQSFNMYAYCGNDPINRVDPDGQFWGKLFRGLLKIFKIFNKIIKIIAIAAVVALGVALAATGLGAIAFAKIAFLVAKALFGVLKFISTAISAIAGKIAGIFKFAAFAFSEGGTKLGLSGLGLLQALGAIEKQIAKRQSRRRKRRREIERKRIEIILKDAKAIMDALTEQAKKLLCKTQGERNCQIQWSIDMGKAEEQYYRTLGGCATPWCVWYAQKEYDRAKSRIGDEEGKCLFEANDKCGTRWP